MQHNDRAKRDRHQGPKASVTIAGDAIQLVARTRGDARTRKISCQCVLFRFKQYFTLLFEPLLTIGLSHARAVMLGHGKSHASPLFSLFSSLFYSFSKQYVMLLFTSYVIRATAATPEMDSCI